MFNVEYDSQQQCEWMQLLLKIKSNWSSYVLTWPRIAHFDDASANVNNVCQLFQKWSWLWYMEIDFVAVETFGDEIGAM